MFILHNEEYYEKRKPQPDLGTVRNFLRFIWNKNKRTFLGKTIKGWGKIGLFYLFFFGVLFGIFILQMWIIIDYVVSQKESHMLLKS